MLPLSSLVRVERIEEEAEEAFNKRRRTRCLLIIGTVTLFTAGIIVMSRVSMIAGQIIVCFTALVVFFIGVFSCCLSVNKTCRRSDDREQRTGAVCPGDLHPDALAVTVVSRIEPACSNPTPQTTLPPYSSSEDLPQYEEAPPYHEVPVAGYPTPQPRYPHDTEENSDRSTYLHPGSYRLESYQPPPSYEEAVNSTK